MNRVKFIIGILVIMFVLAGCKKNSEEQITGWDESGRAAAQQNQIQDIREELSESCRDIYVQSKESGALGSLETIQRMVSRIGEAGYPVIDQYNQTDMENAHLAEIFCKKVNEKQAAGVKLIMVLNNGGFVYFNLNTADGKVDVSAASLSWKEDDLVNIGTDNYQAYTWVYSENGYLIFEKYYMQGFAGPYSRVAVRIKPLTNTCRELNRKYILPIGYGSNNLFITDWSEDDYRDLNFYDLYEIMYPLLFSTYAPYSSDYEGEVNQIPQKEFEEVIRTYFDISSQTLQEKAVYDDHSRTYEYRPRGLYDSGSGTEIPYPEVIDYEYKDDGIIELTVNAVWPARNLGTAFRHKVVIRLLSDSKFQYVSNQVIPSEDNAEPAWYTDRLSEEEIKGYNLPVDEEERKEAQVDCNAAMESIKEIYEGADKGDSINVVISEEIISQMQEALKATGCPVSTGLDYADMYNYEKMENFLMNSMEGKKGDIVTYEVYSGGRIGRRKFIYDGADMYALSTDTAWNKENMPMITGTSKSRIKQWDYTDRGWFFYEYCVPEPPEVSEIIIGDTMAIICFALTGIVKTWRG